MAVYTDSDYMLEMKKQESVLQDIAYFYKEYQYVGEVNHRSQ